MGRVIKFRLWDKKHESFVNEPYHAISLHGTLQIEGHTSVEPKRYSIQQFTGLLDKNGKEMYEGDIVKTGGDMKPLPIILEDGAFQLAGIGYYLNKARVSEWLVEVIGNIYESKSD